jgi:hypothetical protein
MQRKTSFTLCVALLVFTSAIFVAKDEKLKPEELVAKHLQSIGSPEKLKTAKGRSTAGSVQVAFRVGGAGTLNGKGNILSEGNSVRSGFNFAAIDYSGEQLAFDGTKVSTGFLAPGSRSPLSGFIYQNDLPLKEGLMFGVLSTSWALLDVAAKQPKLDFNGQKKIDGRQLYEMKYQARKGNGNLQAFLYFDPETYRHVRSQFKMEVPQSQVTKITDSAELARYILLEEFGDFKEVDGLTLPHSYKLDFTIDSPRGGMLTGWSYVIDRITHNEAFEKRIFTVQ